MKKRIYFGVISYLVVLTLAEITAVYYSVNAGSFIHAILLLFLIVYSSIEREKDFSNLLKALTIVSLIRLLSNSMPLLLVQPVYQFFIVNIILVVGIFLIIKNQGIRKKDVGLRWGSPKLQLIIALTGILFGCAEYIILEPAPIIEVLTFKTFFISSAILLVYIGVTEELIFRGVLLTNSERVLGKGVGLIFVSILFAVMHVIHQSASDLLFVFAVGLFYGYVFLKTRSIFGISVSHGITNIILLLVLPFI